MAQDIPINHSRAFATVMQPTLGIGTHDLVVAAPAGLAR